MTERTPEDIAHSLLAAVLRSGEADEARKHLAAAIRAERERVENLSVELMAVMADFETVKSDARRAAIEAATLIVCAGIPLPDPSETPLHEWARGKCMAPDCECWGPGKEVVRAAIEAYERTIWQSIEFAPKDEPR